jgi:hypothetical protein
MRRALRVREGNFKDLVYAILQAERFIIYRAVLQYRDPGTSWHFSLNPKAVWSWNPLLQGTADFLVLWSQLKR